MKDIKADFRETHVDTYKSLNGFGGKADLKFYENGEYIRSPYYYFYNQKTGSITFLRTSYHVENDFPLCDIHRWKVDFAGKIERYSTICGVSFDVPDGTFTGTMEKNFINMIKRMQHRTFYDY